MARKPKALSLSDDQLGLMTFADQPYDIYNGHTLDVRSLTKRERPEDLPQTFAQCRQWAKDNWFVRSVLKIQKGFLLNRLALVTPEKADRRKFERWLNRPVDEHGQKQRARLLAYIHSATAEWLLQRNLISFWRDGGGRLFPLRPEQVRYEDSFGIESIRVVLGFTEAQLKARGFSPADARRYSDPKGVELSAARGEHWLVLRDGGEGYGLVTPDLFTVFRTLSQSESMEVGESMYAFGGRLVLRTHSLGFEVKAAANAMKQENFLWKAERAAAIEKFFKGRAGFAETTKQFDHKIETYWGCDPKLFDVRKWDTVIKRLQIWAGPCGSILLAQQPNSVAIMRAFRTQIEEERDLLKLHLETAINESLSPPAPLVLRMSSACFNDPRLAWEMAKALANQGPLSATSTLEEANYDPQIEAERKLDEANDKDSHKKYLPLYDPHHGNQPGRPGPKGGVSQRQEGEE